MLELQQHLVEQWHRYKDRTIGWPALRLPYQRIWRAFETTLQLVLELSWQDGERTPSAKLQSVPCNSQ